MTIDYKEMDTNEILDEIREVEIVLAALRAELESRKSAEIIKMRAELEEKAAALGVTLHDVIAIKEKKQRQPAAPKYRDPEKPENTWKGRGKVPTWLKEKIDAGASLDDFLIDPPKLSAIDPETGF